MADGERVIPKSHREEVVEEAEQRVALSFEHECFTAHTDQPYLDTQVMILTLKTELFFLRPLYARESPWRRRDSALPERWAGTRTTSRRYI